MSRPLRTSVFAIGGTLVVSLAPGVAAAGEGGTAARPVMTADRVSEDTTFFAGYVAPLGNDKTVVGTFKAPVIDCSTADEGIDTLVELASDAGAFYVDGALFSSCVDGVAEHYAAFDTLTEEDGPVQIPIEEVVEDGDKLKVSSKLKGDKIKVTYTNKTQDWEQKDSFTGLVPDEASVLQYVITVDGGVTVLPPLSANSKVTDVKISGDDLKDNDTTKYVLVDDAGDALIKPTKIKKGTDFTFKYVG